MVICGHEDLLFFLVFTSFSLGRKTNNFFFRSSLLFGQENGHLRTCPPYYYYFFFGLHFFLSRNIFSNSKWGCENWLVMQRGASK